MARGYESLLGQPVERLDLYAERRSLLHEEVLAEAREGRAIIHAPHADAAREVTVAEALGLLDEAEDLYLGEVARDR